jgi:stage V sporulation protein SpoVS
MPSDPDTQPAPEPDRLEVATDQAIAACGGNVRNAVKALIVANEFLEAEVKQLQAAVSIGYARGKFEPAPRDRKDWYD